MGGTILKRTNRIIIMFGSLALIIISWIVVITAKSNDEKQAELIEQAVAYINDKIYIYAVPVLEEAAAYNNKRTLEAEDMLKTVYLQLIDKNGYKRKYINLLEKQMNSEYASEDVFFELANYYLENSKYDDAFNVFRTGISKTGSDKLIDLYEDNRYIYKIGYDVYENVTSIFGKTIGVQIKGLWGVASSDGVLQIPCEYEKVSTYSNGRVVVQKNSEIYAVDSSNNRIALLKEKASDFGNYSNDCVPLYIKDGWKRSTGNFGIGDVVFEQIGTYSDGYVAAKQDGKWGIIGTLSTWLIPAEYDEIIIDELGCAYAQNAIFVKKGDSVYLFADGKRFEESYEDAQPFSHENYAAVKKNGKWGFIDTSGKLMIDYQFDEALSFGQHLAAVKQGELWGYINVYGKVVIEPRFFKAKSFANGNAPVLTELGWQFISLIEYK